jgi:sec-independent protein translocase protein TatB
MFDLGMMELLVIGVVALIVVGPKDLPGMFRAVGQFTGKMRRMARDFQRAMDDAADGSGMRQTAADLKKMTSAKSMGLDTLKSAADKFDKWEPKPIKPAGSGAAPKPADNAAALKEAQEATAKRLAEARAAREAREAAAKKAAKAAAAAEAPPRWRPREVSGAPTARAARPKNMPKKPSARGRR